MKLEGKVFNFLGDSITEGVGVSSPDRRYFELLKKDYRLSQVNGYGISGSRFADQKNPDPDLPQDRYFASRIDEMEDADGVVVFGGTNDFGHGDAPLGTPSDRTPKTFYGACHDLFERLIKKFPGKPIVIMTPLHRTEEDDIRTKDGIEVTLQTYVDIIREVAEFYSLPVCDMYKNSGLQPRVDIIKEKYIPDGLHPNDAGHVILAKRLGEFLSSL